MNLPIFLHQKSHSLRLALRVLPSSPPPRIIAITPSHVKLAVSAPPQDGAANEAVVKFVCEMLGYPKSDGRIIMGEKTREKVLEIRDVGTDSSLVERVREKLMGSVKS
ncbi:YggU-like protein [Choiromyces venosus 120613-1]|uniref:YggU-like protein n=1 Tax=Choiromyces venosus 120613-1 TaxID=1336337 RepID=A0A3N4JIY5_9PEZI|nr:YggU-like protein [Choiromyces venosus 120613-1]